jgi:hypothetical protein
MLVKVACSIKKNGIGLAPYQGLIALILMIINGPISLALVAELFFQLLWAKTNDLRQNGHGIQTLTCECKTKIVHMIMIETAIKRFIISGTCKATKLTHNN